jgi:hypothetical protein
MFFHNLTQRSLDHALHTFRKNGLDVVVGAIAILIVNPSASKRRGITIDYIEWIQSLGHTALLMKFYTQSKIPIGRINPKRIWNWQLTIAKRHRCEGLKIAE